VTGAGRAGGGRLLVDLHNHTVHSYDARNRPDDYRRAYAAGRFDVLAITDHNTIAGALELRGAAPFPVIVGEEIDTADGELIGLFLTDPVPAGMAAVETAERIRAQGGLVYLQHPFYRVVRGRLRPGAREALRGRGLIDIVESRNGGPFAAGANVRALAWARACGLPHAAASDAHVPAAIGSCLTSIPDGPVDPASLPGRLRLGADVDHRSPAPVAIGRIVAARAQKAVRAMTGAEPPRRRRP
jgi:predicted metal-dependent phosphoesterase TrpH